MRRELERVMPGDVGLRSDVILDYIKELEKITEMHGFMLARHGKVCAAAWWKPYSANLRHCLWSQTKSYTSAAIGILVDEGKLKVSDRIADILPEYMPENVSDELSKLTVRDVLCMATGQHGLQSRTSAKWVEEFFAGEFTHVGERFEYSGVVTSLLGVIIRKITGQNLMAYLKPRLFDKLGIDTDSIKWIEHPDGLEYSGGGLITKTEDNLRLGIMYANKGVFNGERILSEDWIREATTWKIATEGKEGTDYAAGYGYQIWICKQDGAYRFVGAGGQYVIVLPKYDIVIATNQQGEPPEQLELMWKMLDKIEGDAGEELDKELSMYCRTRALPSSFSCAVSPRQKELIGRVYKFPGNDFQYMSQVVGAFSYKVPKNISSMAFTDSDGELIVNTTYGGRAYTLHISTDGVDRMSHMKIADDLPELVYANGHWKNENEFAFTVNFIEGPVKTEFAIRLEDNGKISLGVPLSRRGGPGSHVGINTESSEKRIYSI